MKNWSFNTCAITGFVFSTLAVALVIVNAVTGNQFLPVLLTAAGLALLIGGALSVRAHFLWSRGGSH
ncbi:hypothetical protein [Cryobacterium psychrophilum]|uniref:Uncharacterized protein n=1 Tax=Cryobacterium psychrophilum TaxID=41988 RepID=A0A4Y8KM32_9MICO|nr:hypothetical protein [Cryobacterium psychrophilum]TDW31076.1 hypothetical protein EDD25_2867 [Cryobacterium psychrophilum]TFD78623.1 hypothetical protein E3T53_10635 [Cryobacterium psychrophilum]